MTAPPIARPDGRVNLHVPIPADDAVVEATADAPLPRPALMDRLHFVRAEAAELQRTLGNQVAQRVINERRLTGDAPLDGSMPRPTKSTLPGQHPDTAPRDDDAVPPPLDAGAGTAPSPAQPDKPAMVAPPAATPAMGVPVVTPPAAAPAHTINDLQSQIAHAASAIPHPDAAGFSAAQQAIRAQGFRSIVLRGGAQSAAARGGGGGPERVEDPNRPFEPDPVPKQTRAMLEASRKKLDAIPHPDFKATPKGHIPVLGRRAISDTDLQILKGSSGNDQMDALDKRVLEDRKARREKELAGEKNPKKKAERMAAKPGDDEPKTFAEMRELLLALPKPQDLKDAAKKKEKDKEVDDSVPKYREPEPPGPIVFTAPKKEKMGQVLAGLKAEPEVTAKQILSGIRGSVVSKVPIGSALEKVFPTIGSQFQNEVQQKFLEEVGNLQKGAGISDEELAKRVEERKAELVQIRKLARAGSNQAQIEADRATREQAKKDMAAAAAKKEAADAKHRVVKKAAPKIQLKMDVDSRRTRLLGYVAKDSGEMTVRFKQKGDIRAMTVERMVRDYLDAYKFAAQQDEYEIASKTTDPKSAARGEQDNATREYLTNAGKSLDTFKAAQRKKDDANVIKLQEALRTTADAKSEAIRAWADRFSKKKRSAEQKAADHSVDIAERLKAENAALDQLQRARVSLGVVNDFDAIDRIAAEVKAGHDRETIIANLHLNTIEQAILDAYMTPPEPGDDRGLSGVMAGVRMRVQKVLEEPIAKKIEPLILEEHSGYLDENVVGLDRIGNVQTPGFAALEKAQQVHEAVDKLNTDENAVYAALDHLTKIQAQAIRLAYMDTYKGSTIEGDIKGGYVYGMSGTELKRAQALLNADQELGDALGYRIAMKGNEGAWYHTGLGGADIEELDKINHGKSPEERNAAEDRYNATFDKNLKAKLDAAPSDEERKSIIKNYRTAGKSQLLDDANETLRTKRQRERFAASVVGDDDTADALELRDHLPSPADVRMAKSADRYNVNPVRYQDFVIADRKKIEAVYDRIRREATDRGDREHWTSAQIEAEIARRTQKIERIFNGKFSADYEGPPGASALRTAFDIGFRKHDDEKNLANALADNDTTRVDAAKIHIEHRGIYADDDVENAILQSQYKRALADTRRDEMPLRKLVMARQMVDLEKETRAKARKAAKDRGETDEQADKEAASAWNGKKEWAAREKMQRDIDRTLENAAAEQARGNMNALRENYRKDYGESLDDVVRSDTSGYSGDKAMLLLAQNGRLTLGQTMFYAVRGPGTDEEALKELKGHTKAEIAEARKDFRALAIADSKTFRGRLYSAFDDPNVDHTDMDTEIRDDISGRTGFDIGLMLEGEPETIDEKRERLQEAIDWEKKAGPLGQIGALGGNQMSALEHQAKRLDDTIKMLEDPTLSAEKRQMYLGFFDQDVATVNAGIKAHREMLDTWTDRITTAVGLIVGVVVTIVTFGAAGPVLAAIIGSILATAATMALKAGIKGAAYGWEDIATDLAIGAVDALAAGLTAGIGGKLLGVAKEPLKASRLGFGRAIQSFLTVGKGAVINPAESLLARSIPTSTLLREMVERGGVSKLLALGVAHGGEMLAMATPSALMSSILDENNYKEGNPLGNVLSGAAHQVGTGAIMGLGMHTGMAFGGKAMKFGGTLFEALKTPEAPALHNFELAQREFPAITYDEFIKLRAAAEIEISMRERAVSEHPVEEEGRSSEGTREGSTDATSGERSTDRKPLPSEPVPNAEVGAERPAEMGAPGPNNPSVLVGSDITTPRDVTQAHVNELLPPSLKDKVTVEVDPHEKPGTVKVERVMRLGIVVDVKLVVGPKVRPIDVMLHSQTVHAMRRYVGVTGTIVRAVERMRSFIVRDGVPPFGSKAWNAWHELNKLPKIIEQRLEMLRNGELDAHSEAAIHSDLEHIAKQVDKHRATLDAMDRSPGAGYIALEGVKKPPAAPLADRPSPRERRTDPTLKRYIAEHSALQKKFPDAQFLSIERPWIEAKPEGDRIYRVLEVRDPVTDRVLAVREEIRSIGPGGELLDRWVQRGSESNLTGAAGEEAYRAKFEAEKAAGGRQNQILLPAEMIQRAGGQGFDGVVIEFDDKGRATIILIEVKNYPGRYVPLADITAISENLVANLEHLQRTLSVPTNAKKLGLSLEQMRAAQKAIINNKLEFQLLHGHDTSVGAVTSGRSSVLKDLRADISAELAAGSAQLGSTGNTQIPQDKVTARPIEEPHMRAGKAFVEARERFGNPEELRELAKGHDPTITEEGVRRATAMVTIEKEGKVAMNPPLEVGTEPHSFVDGKKNPFVVFAVAEGSIPAKVATDVASTLRVKAAKPGKPARVVIDVTRMNAAERRALRRNLQTLADKRPKLDLARIVVVDVDAGRSSSLTGLPK